MYYDLRRISKDERQPMCLFRFENVVEEGLSFIYSLEPFFRDILQFIEQDVKPTRDELLKELKKTIKSLKIDQTSQTFAFGSESVEEIYYKPIVLKRKFEFLKEDSKKPLPERRGRLFYDLILPFNNKKHLNRRCIKSDDLPSFYRK